MGMPLTVLLSTKLFFPLITTISYRNIVGRLTVTYRSLCGATICRLRHCDDVVLCGQRLPVIRCNLQ